MKNEPSLLIVELKAARPSGLSLVGLPDSVKLLFHLIYKCIINQHP
jgi:hypothetical protein